MSAQALLVLTGRLALCCIVPGVMTVLRPIVFHRRQCKDLFDRQADLCIVRLCQVCWRLYNRSFTADVAASPSIDRQRCALCCSARCAGGSTTELSIDVAANAYWTDRQTNAPWYCASKTPRTAQAVLMLVGYSQAACSALNFAAVSIVPTNVCKPL